MFSRRRSIKSRGRFYITFFILKQHLDKELHLNFAKSHRFVLLICFCCCPLIKQTRTEYLLWAKYCNELLEEESSEELYSLEKTV